MQHFRKNRFKFKITAVLITLIFASTGFASGFTAGRILPNGKVTLFHGNQEIGEFSSEAPLPENTLLAVHGECGVKLRHLYLFALDRSLFSVSTKEGFRTLSIQKGTVYFALSSMPQTLVFRTPEGLITTNEVRLNAASTTPLLKGYVSVEDGVTRMGVLEGGSMIVTAADDKPLAVSAGHEIRLAQAEIFKEEEKPKEEKPAKTGETGKTGEEGKAGETAESGGMSTTTKVILGVVALGGIAAAAGGGGGGGGGGGAASPSAP
ncbi:MAG: hypothetical protein WB792_03115 [Desulfobacterales bacterium]